MNSENLELPDLHAKLSGHTRDSALISAFQTLKRFEDNLVEQCDSGKPFTNTEPYQVKFEDGGKVIGILDGLTVCLNVIDFLSEDSQAVIQSVESKMEKGMNELEFHENMNKLPRVPYGVDSNGVQVITGESDIDMQVSPSEWTDNQLHGAVKKAAQNRIII